MELILIALVFGAVFGVCYLVDRAFNKVFRSKAQHRSGLSLRASKRYGLFGVVLFVLGCAGILSGIGAETAMLVGGTVVLLVGVALCVYYLSFGIFYDADTFLYSVFGRKDRVWHYRDIRGQRLYILTGGTVAVELYMTDGSTVSVQSNMEGMYPFLDKAFAGWCRQKGIDPDSCEFHDPANSLWFPTEE